MWSYKIPANFRERVIDNERFRSLYQLDVEPVNASDRISGSITLETSATNLGVLKPKEKTLPLNAKNLVRGGFGDAYGSIYVKPDVDVMIIISRKLPRFIIWSLLAGIILTVVLALVIIPLNT